MSNMLNYYVGQTPFQPVPIEIRDSGGSKMDCRAYTMAEALLFGSDNERIDLTDAEFMIANIAQGEFTLRWPRPSVFTKTGVYRLQIKLSNADGYTDLTTTTEIKVRDPRGGK